MTLAELAAAVKAGQRGTMMIDNDHAAFHGPSGDVDENGDDEYETLYEAHPLALTEQALDIIGIPHEPV